MAKKKAVAAAPAKKATIKQFDTIVRPIITEKTMALMQAQNKVTIQVPARSNKTEVKLAFEAVFGVKVTNVNIVNVRAEKTRRGGRFEGKIPGYKKAIVQVKEGEAIDLFKE